MKLESLNQLRALYDLPKERPLKKQMAALDAHCINFIQKSPFLTLATVSAAGKMDVSPRGGVAGFVKVLNQNQLLIPDSKGNNRLDSLNNIIETGQVGILFFLPGMDETLRLNGKAIITTDAELMAHFPNEKNLMKTCILVDVEEVFLHCAKALMRSKLWSQAIQIDRSTMPTMGQMLKDQIGFEEAVESQTAMLERYQGDL